jgi:hypothetical protein
VSARGKSRRLQRALCDCGAEHSFAQSNRRLREHDGFELNASAVREATLGHAAQVSERLRKHCAGTFRTLPRKGPAQVVAETDGSFVCTVGPGRRKGPRPRAWKEIRLSAARAQGALDAHYAAGFHSVAETGQRWGHCARDAGWALESRIHVVADGAEWIALQSREVFGDQADLLVDFYHVSEYLAAAAAVSRPASPRSWLQTQQKRLRRGKPLLVIEAMEPFAEEADTGSDDEPPVRAAIRYLRNRLRCLDYPRALARALPIGSGLIESGHKHVLQARLKKAGSAWLPANADALAQLRVLRANQQWDASWQDQRAA